MTRLQPTARRFGILLAVLHVALLASASHAAQPLPGAKGAPSAAVAVKPAQAAKRVEEKRVAVDLNSAKKEELTTLPGVTDGTAGKIIAGRPYGSKAFLLTNKVVTEEVYLAIRNLVVARQPGVAVAVPVAASASSTKK